MLLLVHGEAAAVEGDARDGGGGFEAVGVEALDGEGGQVDQRCGRSARGELEAGEFDGGVGECELA